MHNIINTFCEHYEVCGHVRDVGRCNGCGNIHNKKDMNKYDKIVDYCLRDFGATQELAMRTISKYTSNPPKIKNVIFNEPATIVFWEDGSKTVVKCQEGDIFDPEKGLTMAITKKVYGNKGNYCEEIKKWVDPYYAKMEAMDDIFDNFLEKLRKGCEDINAKLSLGFVNPAELRSSFGIIKEDDAKCQE